MDISIGQHVVHSVHRIGYCCAAMLLNLSAAEVAMPEPSEGIFIVPRYKQRPVNDCISTSNSLFLCHVGRQNPFKQMSTAKPPPGRKVRKGVVDQPCAK